MSSVVYSTENMIKIVDTLKEELVNYKNPIDKISRLCNENKIYKLKNGLYETNKNIPGYCLSQIIYGPSYLSFDFALAYHGLIPETVYNYTNATYNKKKKKVFKNYFGNYMYQDVPKNIYHFGVLLVNFGEYNIQIASKEKALADKLYSLTPCKNIKEISNLLLKDLRIEPSDIQQLNINDIKILSNAYNCTNVTLLYKFLRKELKKDANSN